MKTRRRTGPTSEVVERLLERAQWACEACSVELGDRRGQDWSVHHRLARRMGGTRWPGINLPSNLLILCGSATTPGGCHAFVESKRFAALAAGWLVQSGQDPAHVKAMVCKSWVYLGNDYRYRVAPEAS